ncbi:hypothetical protein OKW22_001143 [Bacilli bacterium PM5-3]|nr:hypothetical protein [Bacilli bacterium PM5-3]MDH6603771.1 hypothetical protein [Bacilli bacterium PM5-9]
MISNKNKLISFFLSSVLTIISWGIIFLDVILQVTTFFEISIYNVDTIGFTFTTLMLTFYTFTILFKISGISYFPIVLILLHMGTLNGSTLAILFIIVDLLIMLLLNTGADQNIYTKSTYYQKKKDNNSTSKTIHKTASDNIFDAEYKEKDK